VEFMLGATVASALLFLIFSEYNKIKQQPSLVKVRASQSRTLSMLPLVMINLPKPLNTQASNHRWSTSTRILYTDENAYWIKNNQVYVARLENGIIVENSEEMVDMMALSKVQLDEMIFIVEKLTEGKNIDNSGSGN